MSTALKAATIVSFQGRNPGMLSRLIEKEGGIHISAPSMREVPLSKNTAVFEFWKRLAEGDVDVLIFLTGTGTHLLIQVLETHHSREVIVKTLSDVFIIARGPKPTGVLNKLGVSIDLKVPEPNTSRELLDVVDRSERFTSLEGLSIAIQEYGESNPELTSALRRRGATVLPVEIYRWALPKNVAPLRRGIEALIRGEANVALFTSQKQVNHVIQIAADEGLEEGLRNALADAMVVSIGPVCSSKLFSKGIDVDFEPSRPKLGILIRELKQKFPSSITTKVTKEGKKRTHNS